MLIATNMWVSSLFYCCVTNTHTYKITVPMDVLNDTKPASMLSSASKIADGIRPPEVNINFAGSFRNPSLYTASHDNKLPYSV